MEGGREGGREGGKVILSFTGYNAEWNERLPGECRVWENYLKWYLTVEDTKSVLVVMYEDLKEDMAKEMKRMLEFLKQPCNDTVLKEMVESDYTTFLRSKPKQPIEYYNPNQKALISNSLKKVKQMLSEKGSSLRIDRYLEMTSAS